MRYFKLPILVCSLLICSCLNAQDAHFSQFDASPIILNPSLTGVMHKKEMRVVAQHRNQWASVNDKYSTTTMAFDMPVSPQVGVGGYIMSHDAEKNFNTLTFVLSGAYDITRPNQNKHHINMGAQLGFIYKKSNYEELVFDNQYDGKNFDSDLASGETNGLNYSKFMPELNIGFTYVNTDVKKNYHPYGGISFHHLTHPNESLMKEKGARLPLKYSAYGGIKFVMQKEHVIDPKVLFMLQRNAMMINTGLMYTYMPAQTETKISAGVYYRVNDAIIPILGLDYYNFKIMMSYDINVSSLSTYTNGKGSFELTLAYKGLTAKQRRQSGKKKKYL